MTKIVYTHMERKIHYPKRRKLQLYLGIFMIMMTIAMVSTGGVIQENGIAGFFQNLLAIGIPALIGLFSLYAALGIYIATSPNNIECHQIGLHVHAPWGSVSGIGPVNTKFLNFQVIQLSTPAVIDWVWYPSARNHKMMNIPLTNYRYDAESELGQALRLYAPHIFPT